MLNPHNISGLLSQVLRPNALTLTKPISISLLSSNGQPLCSCTSDYIPSVSLSAAVDGVVSNGNGAIDGTSKYQSINQEDDQEESGLMMSPKNRLNNNSTVAGTVVSPTDNGEELDIEENYGNYINADLNPAQNLKIVSLLAFNSWKQYKSSNLYETEPNDWLVVAFFDYFLYIHTIPHLDDKLLLLLVCDGKYPKMIAVKTLDNLSKVLSEKLKDY